MELRIFLRLPSRHAAVFVQVLDEHRALVAQRVMAGASGAETLAAMTEFVDGSDHRAVSRSDATWR